MVEGMDDSSKLTRRKFVEGAVTLGASAAAVGSAEAGILRDLFGGKDTEKIERMKDPFYAAKKYMSHDGSKLQNNFGKLQAIGAEMKNKQKFLDFSQEKRSAKLSELTTPIVEEKNAYLREFDPELITDLLIEYIENGFTAGTQSLIQIYERAGGNTDRIREKGRLGVSDAAIANISSVMTYRIEDNPTADYGKVYRSPLTFRGHEAPKDH